MSLEKSENDALNGEVVPENESPPPPNFDSSSWTAFVSNYSERPDLLIGEIEKHDPGFVKRMNEASAARAAKTEDARFTFSKAQAYASLVVMIVSAFVVLGSILTAVKAGAGFWTIIGLGLVFAITQGGTLGFTKIIDAIAALTGRGPPPE